MLDEGITGNPDELKAEELHALAGKIVQPYFEQAIEESRSRYQELAGSGQTAINIEDVVADAYYQRVEYLFVPVGQQTWGLFDPETSQVNVHGKQEIGDEDLMDLAALHTLLNGGTVYAVEPEKVPGGASIVAMLRY